MTYRKPFLKWAGGKFRLLDRILPEMPVAHRYVEPFAGSAAVYLNTTCQRALVNDGNSDLIALYKYIQKEGSAFIAYAASFFTAENNTQENFYKLRDTFNTTDNQRLKSALFLYLNKHAFNGLIRYNSKGAYNVPFGTYQAPQFPMTAIHHFLHKTERCETVFTCRDFRDVFAELESGDVVYCDPPYVPLSETAHFTSYTGNAFTARDQEDLANLARKAHKEKGVTVILSNHDTPEIRALYADAHVISFAVRRFISCKGNERNKAPEIIAIFK